MTPKEYLRKNVPFDKTNREEMNLYEWLQTLKHGQFAERTKEFWMREMERKNKNE